MRVPSLQLRRKGQNTKHIFVWRYAQCFQGITEAGYSLHYDLVVWRNIWGSDLYCAKVWDFPTEELKANPFIGTDGTLELRLAYFEGVYTLSVNGTQVLSLKQDDEIQNGHSVASILGSGDVRLGLFAERQITFTDWSYSTDTLRSNRILTLKEALMQVWRKYAMLVQSRICTFAKL